MAVNARRREALETLVAVGLLLLAGVLANAVAARWHARADLTAGRRFTLSPETRALLAEADGPIEVRAFLPGRVAAPYGTVVRAIRDILEEYRDAAGGNLRIVWRDPHDPDLDPEARAALAEEARGFGIREAELQVFQGDRRVRQRVHLGVAFLHEDRQAATAAIDDPGNLEYALTRALRDVVRGPARRPNIGVSRGHGEPDLMGGPLAALLEDSGRLRSVEIDGAPLPPDLDVLVIVAPKRPFGARERYVVDQFLVQGGALVALLDYRRQSEQFPDVLIPQPSGLEPLLAHYGVRIDAERTILDRRHSLPAPVGRDARGRPLVVHHPLFVKTDALDRRHPITRRLPSLVVPMAAPIDAAAARAAGLEVAALVGTSPDARARADVRSIDPGPLLEPPGADAPADLERPGPFTVAVAIQGPLASYHAGGRRPVPPPPTRGAAPPPPDPPLVERSSGDVRLVVSTAGLRLLASDENGLVFFQNAVDWAAAETDLVGIRARSATDPPLDPVDPATARRVRIANIFGPPLAVVLFGLARWWRRRRRARA